MASEFVIALLKRWSAGKKLSKSQYYELVTDGLLLIAGPGETYTLTDKALHILNNQ